MKKSVCMLLAACMLLSLAACGARGTESVSAGAVQSLSTVFRLYGQETKVNVEVNGWSTELGVNEMTFYDGADSGTPIASGRVLDRAEYELLVEENRDNAGFVQASGSVKYSDGDGGSSHYIFAVGNGVYFMISARYGAGAEAIYDRFRVSAVEDAATAREGVNYLALVNRLNPLPDGWEDALQTVRTTNAHGDTVEVEARAYAAYLLLKQALSEEDVTIELDSALRNGDDELKGSEYPTGLALDLYLRVKGRDAYPPKVTSNGIEDWAAVHAKLADYGFILRYPTLKEHVTGFPFDAGHIRYIDDAAIARRIMDAGITLEEYFGAASEAVEIDLGESNIYGPMRLHNASILIKCQFAAFADCTLHSLRYSGDNYNTPENVAWISGLAGVEFYQAARFETDFRAGANAEAALTPNHEYKSYPWWLGRVRDGDWVLIGWGADAPEPAAADAAG